MYIKKYENVDIIAFLEEKMKSNTEHYQSDFEYDKQFIIKATENLTGPKNLLWLSRKNGTHCMFERDTFIEGTPANITWKHFNGYDPNDFLAFAVEITGVEVGKVMGNCYELDYMAHIQKVKSKAVKAKEELLTFEDCHEELVSFPNNYYRTSALVEKHGPIEHVHYIPENETELHFVLKEQETKRKAMEPYKKQSLNEKLNNAENKFTDMKAIFTDENRRLKDFGQLMNSDELKDYVKNNLYKFQAFDISLDAGVIDPERCKIALNDFLAEKGFYLTDNLSDRNSMNFKDSFYVQDLLSKEYIGVFNINEGFNNRYFFTATDINDNFISNTYIISKLGLTDEILHTVDWSKYSFEKTESEKNTIFRYLYRDASDYKQYNECIVKGAISEEEKKLIIGCLNDGEYFIPSQVGLPEQRFDKITMDDHCWFELHESGIQVTGDRPTVDVNIKDLVQAFCDKKDRWDDTLFPSYDNLKIVDNSLDNMIETAASKVNKEIMHTENEVLSR